MKSTRRLIFLCTFMLLLGLASAPAALHATTTTFTGEELLGKPTDTAITINIVPDETIEYYYEYGTSSGSYAHQTTPMTATGGQPNEVVITGLSPNTHYYYRMIYDKDGEVVIDYETRPEHTFRTQRAEGEAFVFTVTSDSHNNFGANTATNILNNGPDFNVDLGDTFMVDTLSETQTAYNGRYEQWRGTGYFGGIGQSVPIYLATGNHEEEEGWNINDTPSRAVLNIEARKLYFPLPTNDGFYTGNTNILTELSGNQLREDYYAWEWGDALFVVIDPFQYTMNLPYSGGPSEENDEGTPTYDQWTWTLGATQYTWLKQTLENSNARYKFVFSHQMVGGIPDYVGTAGPEYVRGGAEAAGYFEWGGYNADGSWGFDTERPGWDKPIHQLFTENGVSAYFHGHDHQYVYETRDGVVYQEVPSPSMFGSGFSGIYYEGDHTDSYGAYSTIKKLSNSGNLKITVTPTVATVDYIAASGGGVNYSYTIAPNQAPTDPTITISGTPLTEFTSEPGTPSDEQSYTVSGINLTNDITITPPSYFEISLTSGSGWTTSPLTLTQSGGSVAETDIYVRFNRVTEGTSSGNITHTSSGATQKDVAVNGTAAIPQPTITIAGAPLSAFSSEPGTPSAEQSYTVSGSNLDEDITITPPSDFEISLTSGSGWTTSPLTLTQSGGSVAETDIYVRFNRATEGTSFGNITHTSSGSTQQNVAVSGTAAVTVPGTITLDGTASSGTADGVSSISVSHTTGTGANRLMLVGVSANSYNNARTISSVTFTPSGGSPITLTEVGSIENESGRLSAIYSLLNPAIGQTGTVTVTFSGSVNYGIVVGVANFAGVDQSDPFDDFESATGQGTIQSVDLTGLTGNEVVFDNVFIGAATIPTAAVGSDQTEQWVTSVDRTGGMASIEEATGSSSITMSWSTDTTSVYWAIGAVAINPAPTGPTMPLHNLLLGRPTDDSVTVNAIFDQGGEVYFVYDTVSGDSLDDYSGLTSTVTATAEEPVEMVIDGLQADTKYYYRMVYQATDATEWIEGEEHSFHTQREQGEAFTFTITTDSHIGMTFSGIDPDRYERTTLNVASEHPDFNIDLGDSFIMNDVEDQADADEVYLTQRDYFGNFSHSSPVFLVLGNHEMEKGWNFDNTPSKGLLGMNARKKYFLNPVTDGFYSGNIDPLPVNYGGGLREDYYAWTWGDALFIVLDPFQYTMKKPYAEDPFGEGETDIGDQWDWTLGKDQYDWLKQTLENSNAKFKFVFAHHVTGGVPYEYVATIGPGYVRRGADAAPYFEWGGQNEDGSPGFADHRDSGDFGTKPIHQLMMENHVSAFFHGHDHQYAYEMRDDIVYQAVPSSSMAVDDGGFELYDEGDPYTLKVLDNAGHLRITVAEDLATVDYVRSAISGDTGVTNGEVSYSYTIGANMPVNNCQADIEPDGGDGDVDGSDLAEWMSESSGISLEEFSLEFGRMDCLQ